MQCLDCEHYNGGCCRKYKTSISNPALETDCKKFLAKGKKEEKPKGVQIRDAKRAKNNSKMRKPKAEQQGICRFVTVEYLVFSRINGKTQPTGKETEVALQIDHKVFLSNGKYKFINNKNLSIKRIFADIPAAASNNLIKLYKEYK